VWLGGLVARKKQGWTDDFCENREKPGFDPKMVKK